MSHIEHFKCSFLQLQLVKWRMDLYEYDPPAVNTSVYGLLSTCLGL